MEFVFWLLVGLAVVAAVGHGIWALVRATFRGLSSLLSGGIERPIPAEMCPRCGEIWDRRRGSGQCLLCGLSPNGGATPARQRHGLVLMTLRRRVERYGQLGLISPEIMGRLAQAIQDVEGPAAELTPVSKPWTNVVAPEAPPAADRIEFLEESAPALPPTPTSLPERARAYREYLDARAAAPPSAEPVVPEPPTQRFFHLLSAFLEEKSIHWGELVGGLLIVGCSLALVISFWSSIAERPMLKYVLLNGVTAMLFGLGIHAERRWKLPTTALGLMIIATLLTPLNFLAVASLVRGARVETGWLSLAGEMIAVAIFGALLFRAGRSLVADAPWALLAGVLLPSASMLLARRSVDPGRAMGAALALGSLPWLAHGAAIGGWMARSRRDAEIREGPAVELLRLLGLSTFAAAIALGLVIVHGGTIAAVIHRLSPLAPLIGASILAPGLFLWRRTTAQELVGYRTTGTAIAAAGTLILLAGVAQAWPAPARMLPVALLNFVVLTAIAVSFRVPAAHALAGLCLALVYLLGWVVATGRLGWLGASSAQTVAALASSGSGAALVPLALTFGSLAAAGVRIGRRLDAQAYAMVAALTALVSLGLVTWLGFGRPGDPAGATWVYAAYAVAATAFAPWFARHPLVAGPTETRLLGWIGSGLFLASLVQALVYGRWPLDPGLPWIVALLAHASVTTAASLFLNRLRGDRLLAGTPGYEDFAPVNNPAGGIATDVLDKSALAASLAAACGLAIAVPVAAASDLAANGLWLAAIWVALAWRFVSPALFASGQGALTAAVAFAVAALLGRQGWYARSPLPWLDPWTIQALGLALGSSCLGWIALRLGVRTRPKSMTILGRLLDPPWPAFDRYVRGAVVLMTVALAVYAALPGAAQELTPRDVAIQLQGSTPTGRVAPPITAFEIPHIPHAHALGAGSWALLGLAIVTLLAGQWERFRRADLLAALAVATMAAPLVSGQWETSVAVASALRWSSAIALFAASCLIWNRENLERWASRLGWRIESDESRGQHGLTVGTVLGLGLLPLAAMGLYVGMAALDGRTLDEDLADSWILATGLSLMLGAANFGLRRIGGDRRAWARPAGSLLAVIGTLPLVAVTVFVVASALAGNPIVGPEPGSFFRRIGPAGSYVPPILLMAATLVGFAIRERSSGFAFAAGLTLNLAATVGYLMAVAKGGPRFDASLWVRLAQLNALVASVTALAWIGALFAGRRWLGDRGPAPADGLLGTTIALGVALNLIVLIAGTWALWLDPMPASVHRAIAGPFGLVTLALTAASIVVWTRSLGKTVVPDWSALGLLCLADLLALGMTFRDTGNWFAYHGVLAGQALVGVMLPLFGWNRSGLRLAAVSGDVRAAVGRWSTVALGVVVLFSIRGYWSDPQSPWWTVGGLALMGGLAAGLACWSGRPGYLKLACVLVNLAATFWWVADPAWSQLPSARQALSDLVNINIVALALPAPSWLWIEMRVLRPTRPEPQGGRPWLARERSVPFQRVVAWTALASLTLVVVASLGVDEARGIGDIHALLGWASVLATAIAIGCGLWDQGARAPIAGLYLLGLTASGWAVAQFHLPSRWLVWTGTMVLAAYSVGTSFLWCRRAALRGVADRIGIPKPNADDPVANLSWLVPANLALAVTVMILAFATIVIDPEIALRSASAHAALAQCLAIGLLARGARRSRLQAVTLGIGVAGAVAWGWAWITPGSPTGLLDRSAVVLSATIGGAALYGIGLSKLLRRANDWTLAARRLVPSLLIMAAAVLVVILAVELFERSEGHAIPMSAPAVAAVALALVGAAVAALIAAVVPGRDPLGLSERGRTAYIYSCEVLLALLGMHARLALPWLFSGWFIHYWPLILLGVAFVGVGLSELFRRQGRLVLAEPLERTGALLPVFPLLAAFWTVPRPGEDVLFLALVGGLYTTLSLMRSSLGFGALAALASNAAIWSWLGHQEGLALFKHPQVWVIPPALCVLVGDYLNQDRLTKSQTAGVRYAAALAIYLASTADILLTGVAQAPWLPAVLAALSIAGIFAGILLRVRGFLFLGLGFLSLSVFTIIWYAAVDLHQTWLWAASGVVAGIVILVVFALFEKKRQDVLRVVGQLKEWNP